MSDLPERITAMRTVTYDVQTIVQDILNNRAEDEGDEVTLDEVMGVIEEYIYDDLGSPITRLREITIQDENGYEIEDL